MQEKKTATTQTLLGVNSLFTGCVNSTRVILAPIKIKKKKTGKTYTNNYFTYTLHVRIHRVFYMAKMLLVHQKGIAILMHIYIYLFLLDKNNSPASKVMKKYRACQIVHIEL